MSLPEDVDRSPGNKRDGGPTIDALVPKVYKQLCGLAEDYMRQERDDHTLEPASLVHEAYLRLAKEKSRRWENRAHFFASAALAMRQILVDHAKRRHRKKRIGRRARLPLLDTLLLSKERGLDLIALDEALTNLVAINPNHARLVDLRFCLGLTIDQTAEVLGISTASVEREWRSARDWLYFQLSKGDVEVDDERS